MKDQCQFLPHSVLFSCNHKRCLRHKFSLLFSDDVVCVCVVSVYVFLPGSCACMVNLKDPCSAYKASQCKGKAAAVCVSSFSYSTVVSDRIETEINAGLFVVFSSSSQWCPLFA